MSGPRIWRATRGFAAAAAAVVLAVTAACSSDKPKPTPLEPLTPTIAGRAVWQANVGSIGFGLQIAVRDGQLFAAGDNGTVLALDAQTGAERWRTQLGGTLSAGVGSDGRFAAVVTRDNELVVLEGGRERWRARVPARVVTAPFVGGERVFVMSVDRVVHAFDALDGRRLWTYERPGGDALTLAQTGVMLAAKNELLIGHTGRLVALDALRGSVNWDVPIGQPRGSNEVERLADLVGPALRVGDRVCARSFQNAVGCVDLPRRSLLWSRNTPGVNAIGGDAERVFGGDASDRLTAWSASTGEILWTQERLLYRGLSGALAVGPSVVFGDGEGIVHFLAAADGKPQLRLPTDGKAIVGTPVLAGTTIVVATRGGGIHAFRPN